MITRPGNGIKQQPSIDRPAMSLFTPRPPPAHVHICSHTALARSWQLTLRLLEPSLNTVDDDSISKLVRRIRRHKNAYECHSPPEYDQVATNKTAPSTISYHRFRTVGRNRKKIARFKRFQKKQSYSFGGRTGPVYQTCNRSSRRPLAQPCYCVVLIFLRLLPFGQGGKNIDTLRSHFGRGKGS